MREDVLPLRKVKRALAHAPRQKWKTGMFADNEKSRFWAKVAIAAPDECWRWTASTGNSNYGHFWIEKDGRRQCINSHRLAWVLTYGEIENGYYVLHRCNNKRCCNPRHLFIGTPAENTADAMRDGLSGVKLRADDIRAILAERHAGRLRVEIAARHGVRETYVSEILVGRVWHQVTGLTATASLYIGKQLSLNL